MPSQQPDRQFRFGVFEANTATCELRKAGVLLRLQDQSFQVLTLLLEKQGQVVTREELRQKLWPDGTFVDFDHSLNTIINKLREALNDSANNPRFIATLARRGYRFLLPVEISESGRPLIEVCEVRPSVATRPSTAPQAVVPASLFTRADELPPVSHGYVRILLVLIQIMYLNFYLVALARLSDVQDLREEVFGLPGWIDDVLIASAVVAIPIRLYLLSFVAFNVADLATKFRRLFIPVFILDELWALAPFLLVRRLGGGLVLGVTAALIYLPFAQRTLVLMRTRAEQDDQSPCV
jgi:cholera toxin transcriptional activator